MKAKYNKKELKMGLVVEGEHTSNYQRRLRVAKDHLNEDPKYYTKLKRAGL